MSARRIVLGAKTASTKLETARSLCKTMTLPEKILWERLRAGRLNGFHFRRQQIIRGFIVDFYCHAAGLAVEIDGPIYEQQQEYDQQREAMLLSMDIHVIRFRNEDVLRRTKAVVRVIRSHCNRARRRLSNEASSKEGR